MSNRASERAEARRRARLAARGEPQEPDAGEGAETTDAPARSGFLRRLFPDAPPLPGRPDPLADFRVRGPLRPIAERLYLLARSPLAWVLPAGLWAIGYFSTLRQDLIGMLSLLLSFATLVAAGWFGWQRPTLYGAAAAGLGVLALGAFLLWGASTQGYLEELLGPILIEVFVRLLPIQLVIGFVAGWYGGYLRRRAAQVNRSPRPQRR